jgi:hypothetical protein
MQLLQPFRAHPCGELLIELVEYFRAGVGLIPSPLGEAHQGGAPVRGVGAAFHVAVFFEVVHQVADRLVGQLGPLGQLPDARSLGPQVLEDRHVGRADVIEAELLQAGLDVLHGPVVPGPHQRAEVAAAQPPGMARGFPSARHAIHSARCLRPSP